MAKTIGNQTEREVEALLEKLIVNKIREAVRTESDQAHQTLEDNLRTSQENKLETLAREFPDVTGDLEQLKEDLNAQLEQIQTKTDGYAEQLVGGIAKIEQLDVKLEQAQGQMGGYAEQLTKRLDNGLAQVGQLDAKLIQFQTATVQAHQKSDEERDFLLQGLEAQLDHGIAQIGEKFDGQSEQLLTLNQQLLQRQEEESVFETELRTAVQAITQQIDTRFTELAEIREQEVLPLMQQLQAQKEQLDVIQKLAIALLTIQSIGIFLLVVQLLL